MLILFKVVSETLKTAGIVQNIPLQSKFQNKWEMKANAAWRWVRSDWRTVKLLVKFFLTAVDTNNFPFEKLAWPAFEQGSLSRKIVDFFAVQANNTRTNTYSCQG